MALPLDFVVFVAVLVLTLTLVLVNFLVYLRRGSPRLGLQALLGFALGVVAIGVIVGGALFGLGAQYGGTAIVARWGFTAGWAFLLALGAACAGLFERNPAGKISVTLNVVATLMLGVGFVGGLIASPDVPAFPASLVNLALAAVFTALFRWTFERRRKPKGFLAGLADRFPSRRRKKGIFERIRGFFRAER